jgi:hypothetical protein
MRRRLNAYEIQNAMWVLTYVVLGFLIYLMIAGA